MTKCVLAGDVLLDLGGEKLGPGLSRENNHVKCHKSGLLVRNGDFVFVDSPQSRYVPVQGDQVIGIVQGKLQDWFRVDLGSSEQAVLSVVAFESATKRSYPDLKVGDIVYGKVVTAHKHMEPEVVCIDSLGKSAGLGPLSSSSPSTMLRTSCNFCRKILSSSCSLLPGLKELYKFELCVGHNGRIFVAASSHGSLLLLINALLAAEFMDDKQIEKMLRKLKSTQFVDIK